MSPYFKIFLLFISTMAIFMGHSFIADTTPFPFNHINLSFIAIAWLLIYTNNAQMLWVGAGLSFLNELFSSLPFGLTLIAFLASLVLLNWCLSTIFTNRSWYIILIASLMSLVCYRVLFIILVAFLSLFHSVSISIDYSLLVHFFFEIGLSTIILTLAYWLSTIFFKRLNPRYIMVNEKNIYG